MEKIVKVTQRNGSKPLKKASLGMPIILCKWIFCYRNGNTRR